MYMYNVFYVYIHIYVSIMMIMVSIIISWGMCHGYEYQSSGADRTMPASAFLSGFQAQAHANWLATMGRSPLLQHGYSQTIIRH